MAEKLDAKYVKERMLKYLEEKGPELPVHIAKHMSMSSLFTSAFLSEMAKEGAIRISNMKVGGSPLYYSPSKLNLLENFVNFLGAKEREACLLLKERKILDDREQEPAIRVALRSLKDFAFTFKKDEKIFWRYFTVTEDEVRSILGEKIPEISEKAIESEKKKEKVEEPKIQLKSEEIEKKDNPELNSLNKELEEKRKQLALLSQEIDKKKIEKDIKPESKKQIERLFKQEKKEKSPVKKKPVKIPDKFLNEVKELILRKNIEILNIEGFDKKSAMLKVIINNEPCLLAAYDKKKIEDSDLIKAYKKALSMGLSYHILSKGEPSKKTKEAIEAYRKLGSIQTITENMAEEFNKDTNNQKQ